jgi:hypothetical protein
MCFGLSGTAEQKAGALAACGPPSEARSPPQRHALDGCLHGFSSGSDAGCSQAHQLAASLGRERKELEREAAAAAEAAELAAVEARLERTRQQELQAEQARAAAEQASAAAAEQARKELAQRAAEAEAAKLGKVRGVRAK